MKSAIVPTQALSMLEDALLLSSFARTIKFINVDCRGAEELEGEHFELLGAIAAGKWGEEEQTELDGAVRSFTEKYKQNLS